MKTQMTKKEWTIRVYAGPDVPRIPATNSSPPFQPIKLLLVERTSKMGTKIGYVEATGWRGGGRSWPPQVRFRIAGYYSYPDCPEWIIKAFRSAGWRGKVEERDHAR